MDRQIHIHSLLLLFLLSLAAAQLPARAAPAIGPEGVIGQPGQSDPQNQQTNNGVYTVKKNHPGQRQSTPDGEPTPPIAPPAAQPSVPPQDAPDSYKPSLVSAPSSRSMPPAGSPATRSPQAGAEGTPRATSGEPLTNVILRRQLGSAGFQQLLGQLQSMGSAQGDNGRGAPTANTWFDGARLRTGNDDGLRPSGTPFFQGHFAAPPVQQSPPVTSGSARPATIQDANQTLSRYKSIPGGVVLEGVAAGIGNVSDVQYDQRFNAFIFDNRFAYFMRVPPTAVGILCRAIAEDPDGKIGVSLGSTQIVYGRAPEDSEVVWDLKMADHFLGDIVFARNDWTKGYHFANGYVPQPYQGANFHVAVFFVFDGFAFTVRQQQMYPAREGFLARLFPLTNKPTADGGLEPDTSAIGNGQTFPEFQQNAQHVADNIAYYRREKIVDRMFAYGEVAALRELKRQGFDLEDLANHIPANN